MAIAPRDELGNDVALQLTPDVRDHRILAFFPWSSPEWSDYGKIPPETPPAQWPEPKRSRGDKFLEPGHLYRFVSEMKKIDLLIYVEPER